ncbi:cytochrome c [Alienimonas sp. DA493]|uniref:cytochrome c n=1 Tax=Alienimonas sp. DA493 TaxID=3373605 RepID=UPI003754874B
MRTRLLAGGLLAAAVPALGFAYQTGAASGPDYPEVPADVFFPDPFTVFADQTPVPGAAPLPQTVAPAAGGNGGAMAGDAPTGGPVDAVAAGGTDAPETADVDWAALLPPEQLDAQVRAVMEDLAKKSRDVQTYNNAYLAIPPAAAELASLFAVGTRYDSGVSWADNGAALAQKAAEINETNLRRGAGGQKQVADPLRTLDALLNGGGAGSGGEVDFSEAADFNLLMKRFQVGVDSLKALASSQALLEANRDAVAREARVLAVLSEISADESHGWGFEPEFVALSNKMTEAATATAEAAATDFDAFDAARRRLTQTCSDCHGEYRN